jgi:1-phosphofructokinase/tagatose 6-phosphate kinase
MAFLSICMNPTLQKTLCFPAVIPDRVNRTARHRLDASGKGVNVSRVLTQLGKRVLHLTQLGGELGPLFLELCKRDGVAVKWVESGSAVRFCYTLIGEKDKTVTELVEEGEQVEGGTEQRFLAAYTEALEGRETVIFSGTKAAGFSDALVPEMVRLAREKEKRIILDVRGSDLLKSLPWNPDIIKPNLYEFTATFAPEFASLGELTGEEAGVKERIREICLELGERYHTRIILTRGIRPLWITWDGAFSEFPVEKAVPLNPIGSGDAFTAGFAAALEDGNSFREALAQGTHCGALNAALLRPGVIE